MNKIFLIGMPGSGKSTAGRGLSAYLKIPFVDLDDEIVRMEGQPITEIFAQKGEAYFRKVERKALLGTVENKDPQVIATGGGAPCFFDNLAQMKKAGIVLFIDVPLPQLVERTMRKTTRPLLNSSDPAKALKELYEERIEVYRKAQLSVTPAATKQQLIKKIIQVLGL